MVKKIKIKHFTVINDETLQFSQGLNVIIGENSVGKSHILKLVYSLISILYQAGKEAIAPNKQMLQKKIAEKLLNVFRPNSLGRLVRRGTGRQRCEIEIFFKDSCYDLSFTFSSASKNDVNITKMPSSFLQDAPIFFPTREVLSIFPGFADLYRNRYMEFDETYYDLCLALEAKPLRGPRFHNIKPLLKPLENIIGGSVKVDNGRFYLAMPGKGNMEISLVAEGVRKIAMLAYLITNGSLKDKGALFWDEPETNLNPKLIKEVAKSLMALAQSEIQVFIATHSLFLLRELEILSVVSKGTIAQRYIVLSNNDEEIQVYQSDTVEEAEPIVSLDEALEQSDRYLGLE
jgi:predicted ATPase